MTFSDTTRPQHTTPSGAQNPAVVNVRRPQPAPAEPAAFSARPQVDGNGLDDAPLPPTALRLPDLSRPLKAISPLQFSWPTVGEALQWTGLGLGGLLALWLIFGGRAGPMRKYDNAPAPNTPAHAHTETKAPNWTPPAPDAPEAPRWEAPKWQVPVETSTSPIAPETETPDGGQSPATQFSPPGEEARSMPPSGGPAVRTAQRPMGNLQPGPGDSPPGEAHSLGITVPVPQ